MIESSKDEVPEAEKGVKMKEENGGVLDKSFVIEWPKFRNSIILTNTEGTKRIQTRIYEVIEFNQK